MRRALALSGLPLLIALAVPGGALACSCAPSSLEERLANSDAAINARLLHMESTGDFSGRFTYKINAVFKGRARFDLREDERITINAGTDSASCGLPTRKRVYGLLLYRSQGALTANLCTLAGPQRLREAARSRPQSNAQTSGCQAA